MAQLAETHPVDRRRWAILATVLIGAFMAILDVTIVNVAIPSLRQHLHGSYGSVELIVTAYTIAYASLLITGGRWGDIFGRRRMFMAGMAIFGTASALCGMAPNVGVLVAARALQGIGGACFYPQIIAIIQRTFAGQARNKALSIFGAVLGMSAIVGQILGGLLLKINLFGLSWRPLFLVNVPLACIAIVGAWRLLPANEERETSPVDVGGVVLITLLLVSLCIPLLEGRDLHWPVWLLALFVAVVPLTWAFIKYERQAAVKGRTPLIRLELFSTPYLKAGIPIALLFMVAYASFLFLFSVYVQSDLGFSPLRSGLTYLPAAVSFLLGSLAAARLVQFLGRQVLSWGYITAALGLLVMATVAVTAGGRLNSWEMAPGLFLTGWGLGLGFSPLVGIIVSGLKPSEAGSGAGIITTTLQAGNVLGVAVLSLVFFTLKQHLSGDHAFAIAFVVSAASLVGAALYVQRLPALAEESGSALLERLPSWAARLAYSLFWATGGRVSDKALSDLIASVGARRIDRARQAPDKPGDFLVYHFRAAENDNPYLYYLMREALVHGAGRAPHEAERRPIIDAQVDEVRRRQQEGLLPRDISPETFRLAVFALVRYPYMLPQITRLVTGYSPEEAGFRSEWERLLHYMGDLLEHDAQMQKQSKKEIV